MDIQNEKESKEKYLKFPADTFGGNSINYYNERGGQSNDLSPARPLQQNRGLQYGMNYIKNDKLD